MVPELERPRITEIHVRMDCNGCVQKIKKAVNSIDGVYDLYIDLPQQKLTVIGRADPERIIKAIKKVRKVATICSHTEVPDQNSQPQEPPADGGAPPPEGEATRTEGGDPSSTEPPRSEVSPPTPEEPTKDQPPAAQQPPPENPPAQNPQPETNPPPSVTYNAPSQPENPLKPNDQEEIHVIYHHPPDYAYRYGYGSGHAPGYSHGSYGHWNSQPGSSFRHETPAQPMYHEPPHRVHHELPHHVLYQERPQPVYYEPPPPRSVYHDSPRHVYHDSPRHVYHEPSTRPVYHEPLPRTSYHDPMPRPSYHEPPPQPSYHEPPSQPSYHEPLPRPSYQEPPPPSQPVYVTHSYNTSRPSPYVTAYQYVQSPPRYTTYSTMDHYSTDPYWDTSASSGNAGSMFSDENPNACTIV